MRIAKILVIILVGMTLGYSQQLFRKMFGKIVLLFIMIYSLEIKVITKKLSKISCYCDHKTRLLEHKTINPIILIA